MSKFKNILLYGFSKFGTITKNPSEEIINKISTFTKPKGVKIDTKIFEVSYSSLESLIRSTLLENCYDIIIGFGACPGCTGLRLEKTAFNMIDSPYPDVKGCRIRKKKIINNSDNVINTNLNLEKIKKGLLAANIPSYISNERDLYLCNYAFYLTAYYANTFRKKVKYGFVHFPLTCEFVCKQKKRIASLPLDLMVKGARIIIEQTFNK